MFKIAHISGLGWSGSSALVDFLFDQSIITGIKSEYPSETSLFDGFGSLIDFYSKKGYVPLNRITLNSILSGGDVDSLISKEFIKSDEYNKYLSSSSKVNKNLGGIFFLSDEKILVASESLQHDSQSNKKKSIKLYFKFLYSLAELTNLTTQKVVVFDNDPHIQSPVTKMLPRESIKILIVRNPGDQISHMISETNIDFSKPTQRLKKTLRASILLSLRLIYLSFKSFRIRFSEDTLIILFEDFVNSSELRKQLLTLFVDTNISLNTVRFNPESSAKGIGISKLKLNYLEKLFIAILCNPPYTFLAYWNNIIFNIHKIKKLKTSFKK